MGQFEDNNHGDEQNGREKNKTNLRVDTSDASQQQKPQRQRSSGIPISEHSAKPSFSKAYTNHQRSSSLQSSKPAHLPSDTRPERKQRPEDLRRAQYLIATTDQQNKEKLNENDEEVNQKDKWTPPTCWTMTSWILTWWAPSFLLSAFGKLHLFVFFD